MSSSSKQEETMIKKYSLFFSNITFGELFCFSGKNRFWFDDIIFLMMKPGK